ncbi:MULTISPECIES: hypothetical protein [Bradyrhizobium]|jgi:hypothetical protein
MRKDLAAGASLAALGRAELGLANRRSCAGVTRFPADLNAMSK